MERHSSDLRDILEKEGELDLKRNAFLLVWAIKVIAIKGLNKILHLKHSLIIHGFMNLILAPVNAFQNPWPNVLCQKVKTVEGWFHWTVTITELGWDWDFSLHKELRLSHDTSV